MSMSHGDLFAMIERLEKRIQEDRGMLGGGRCINRPFEREQYRFYDGYEVALRDICVEIGKEM